MEQRHAKLTKIKRNPREKNANTSIQTCSLNISQKSIFWKNIIIHILYYCSQTHGKLFYLQKHFIQKSIKFRDLTVWTRLWSKFTHDSGYVLTEFGIAIFSFKNMNKQTRIWFMCISCFVKKWIVISIICYWIAFPWLLHSFEDTTVCIFIPYLTTFNRVFFFTGGRFQFWKAV